MDAITIKNMAASYLTASLWSSFIEGYEPAEYYDEVYCTSDFTESAWRYAVDLCRDFVGKAEDLGIDIVDVHNAGHNFWLSRNGHGSGFFDEVPSLYGGQDKCLALQDLAESYGKDYVFVTDNYQLDFELHR